MFMFIVYDAKLLVINLLSGSFTYVNTKRSS